MGPAYGKFPILFPYHSHIYRDSYGSGTVWVPENPTDSGMGSLKGGRNRQALKTVKTVKR